MKDNSKARYSKISTEDEQQQSLSFNGSRGGIRRHKRHLWRSACEWRTTSLGGGSNDMGGTLP